MPEGVALLLRQLRIRAEKRLLITKEQRKEKCQSLPYSSPMTW